MMKQQLIPSLGAMESVDAANSFTEIINLNESINF